MTDHDPLCRRLHWDGGDCFYCRLLAEARADEREKVNVSWQVDFDNEMADLRAKVSALPRSGIEIPYAKGVEHEYEMVRRADVLRLIDGGSDGDA